MDGRTQLPVSRFMKVRFGAEYVDTITEPGPVRILDDRDDARAVQSILDRVAISVEKHGSGGISIMGHYDCAGNPVDKDVQLGQIRRAVDFLKEKFPGVEVIGLWVGESWEAEEVA